MARQNVVIAMIGTNGTGKTSVTKEIASIWKASRPKQNILAFDVHEQLLDITDFRIKRNNNWAKAIDDRFRGALVILDDYKLLVETYTPTEFMKDLFINRRHSDNDYIYSCHSPSDVLPQIIPYTTHFYIFYSSITQGKFKERLPNSDMLMAASSYVNRYCSLHGRGLHKNDPLYNGQGFPYFIVEPGNKTQPVKAFNMNKPLYINPS